MTRHTRVGLIRERETTPPPAADSADPDVVAARLRALGAAIEQLADAIDVLTEPGTPALYADEHVRRAREELHAVWGERG